MAPNNRERAHVRVSGNVQGVFFRDSARRQAEQLGLVGWIENLPDGRVEAVFEGPTESVREMVGWCESGPSQADVENVEADYGEAGGDLRGFKVR